MLPTDLEMPGDLLTNGVYFVADGLQDLVANNFDGFLNNSNSSPRQPSACRYLGTCYPFWDWRTCWPVFR